MIRKNAIVSILSLILIIIVFLLLRNSTYQNEASVTTAPNKSFKIYLITMDKTDQHWYYVNEGAADMARLLGVTYLWVAPEHKNSKEQINLLNKAVADGADLIMLAATDPDAISGAIEDAKAKGVKFIYVDSPAKAEAIVTLATNNYNAGVIAGNTMLSELKAAGFVHGDIGIISVNTVTESTLKRESGFRNTVESDGSYTILSTMYENGDPEASQEAASALIKENDNLVGLFGTNEGSTVGVGNAIKNQSKKMIGIGFDRNKTIQNLLEGGSLKVVLVQNPYTMGYLGMAQAVAALKGLDTGPQFINTGVSLLNNQ